MNKIKAVGVASLISIFLLGGFKSIGQEQVGENVKNKSNKSVKLYSNFSYAARENSTFFEDRTTFRVETRKQFEFGYLSPSILFINKGGNFHELELSRLAIRNDYEDTAIDEVNGSYTSISGQNATSALVAIRYEYAFKFFKKKDGLKLRPYFGFAVNPYFSNLNIRPVIAISYPSSDIVLGTMLALVPRLNYNLTEKWFIDINIPINISNIGFTRHKTYDSLTAEKVVSNKVDFDIFPLDFIIRLGIGLKI